MSDTSCDLPVDNTGDAETKTVEADKGLSLCQFYFPDVGTALESVSLSDKLDTVKLNECEVKKCSGDARPDEGTEAAPDVLPGFKIADTPSDSITEPTDIQHKDPSTALDRLADNEKSGWGWSSLSSWGTSVLNTAATSVNTFKTHVGEGLHQVMETVESGLLESDNDDPVTDQDKPTSSESGSGEKDIVTNQEMVRHGLSDPTSEPESEASKKNVENSSAEAHENEGWLSGWGLGGLPVLSDVVNRTSSIVHKTGSVVYQTVEKTTTASKKVISSGLDVLETIGKKTYDVLAEEDQVLAVSNAPENQPTLSQRLREAKDLADIRAKEEEASVEARKSNFSAQFDDYQGLVQLEALESLFSTSESKVRGFVEMLPTDSADPLKSDLMRIKQIFDAVEDNDDEDAAEHDFGQLLSDYFGKLNLNVSIQKILTCQEKTRKWLSDCESSLQKETTDDKTAKEIHQIAIQSLAEMTSCATEHWRRVGQQLLVLQSTPVSSLQSTATELAGITKVLSNEVMLQAGQFVNCLTLMSRKDDDGTSSELITGVYLEAGNASGYIRNGFRLLLPVIQLTIIKAHPLFKEVEN